jgi:hypothetical protein
MSRLILTLALLLPWTAASAATLCYGQLDGLCRLAELSIDASDPLPLPGDITLEAPDEARITLTVTLPEGTSWASAEVDGERIQSADPRVLIAASSTGRIAFTDLSIDAGAVIPGDRIVAEVRAFNPNSGAVLFAQSLTLADIRGVTDALVLTLNPAANAAQQTFLRLVNLRRSEAIVRLRPTDDAGVAGGEVELLLSGHEALQLTSDELEAGSDGKGLIGAFGDGAGKWRVRVVSDGVLAIHVLVRGADGSLSALERLP